MSTSPVTIVTGGSSGIGLALVKHLHSIRWRVAIADLVKPKETISDTIFVQTDVTSWDAQFSMFKQVHAWGGRLDFCALNAGLDDRDDIFGSLSYDEKLVPGQPNTKAISVNFIGTYYGIKLAAHYMCLDSQDAGKLKRGGKIAVTASGGGIYPIPALPQYTATKHALVGLVRALASGKAASANVRINAVCPAIVDTKGLPEGLADKLPADQLTPVSTIIRCFDAVACLADIFEDDLWVEKGPTGQVVEGNIDELIWHQPPTRQGGPGGRLDRQKADIIVAQAFEKKRLLNVAASDLASSG